MTRGSASKTADVFHPNALLMTTVSDRMTATPVRIDELVSLAAEVGGIAREQAERTEANRNVSAELMAMRRLDRPHLDRRGIHWRADQKRSAWTARAPGATTSSSRCHSAWQPNRGRRSTYRRGKTVQTTETTSMIAVSLKPIPGIREQNLHFSILGKSESSPAQRVKADY